MTDRQALIAYRVEQARETIAVARTLLSIATPPRSVINRA